MDQKKARKQLPQTTSLSDLTESLTMGLTLEGVAKKAQLLGARDSVPVPIFQGHDQKRQNNLKRERGNRKKA